MVTTTNHQAVDEAGRHVAEQLKQRIGGDEQAGSVVITYPHDHEHIGKWANWLVLRPGGTRARFLGSLVPWDELYALFRDTFQPLGIVVNSPRADIYHDSVWDNHGRPFDPSGRTVELRCGEVAYLRAVRQSPHRSSGWAVAALHVDSNVAEADGAGPRVACVVDRFDGRRDYWDIFDIVEQMPTIYVRFLDAAVSSPVARLVAANRVTGVAVFELDALVELDD